jgi:hypothetical protein
MAIPNPQSSVETPFAEGQRLVDATVHNQAGAHWSQ